MEQVGTANHESSAVLELSRKKLLSHHKWHTYSGLSSSWLVLEIGWHEIEHAVTEV